MRQVLIRFLIVVLVLLPLKLSANGDARQAGGFDRFIVMFKPGSVESRDSRMRQLALDRAAAAVQGRARQGLRLGGGADVVLLERKLAQPAAQAFMNGLRRQASVQYVEIDRLVKPVFVPNDTFYYQYQWNLSEPVGGINMPSAWDLTNALGVLIAIVDSGRTIHSDIPISNPGYDFISDPTIANDGNGRDPDAEDTGDWAAAGACGVGEPATDSSWHGTTVAGVAAAIVNNSQGVAGVARNATVMPLRVLGKCGGHISDVSDAIRWSVGASVPGLPANNSVADIINLSLGTDGVCGPTLQASIDQAVAAGAVVVVAAGNENADAANTQPANCAHVVVAAATLRTGARAAYSNFGTAVDIAAPGGGPGGFIATASNSGLTAPAQEGYVLSAGTSMSAPQVAGVAAMMQGANPSTPADVEAMLKATARAFPIDCPEGCGAGIVNAAAAVGAAKGGMLSIDDRIEMEGSEVRPMVFTARLSKAMPTAVSFDVTTTNGEATYADFSPLDLQGLQIPAGQMSKSFNVWVNGDSVPESTERFTVTLSNVSGVAVADGQAQGALLNDDPLVLVNDVWSVPQGVVDSTSGGMPALKGGEYAIFKIDVPAGATSLSVRSTGKDVGGSSTNYDGDLYVRRGSLPTLTVADCISAGPALNEQCDFAAPQPGTYYVMLNAYSNIYNAIVKANYLPLDPPELTLLDSSASEGSPGSTGILYFTARLSRASTSDVTFDFKTSPGTATADVDYQSTSVIGKTIPAGTTETTVLVQTNPDTVMEPVETLAATVSNVQGASVARGQALGRITEANRPLIRVSGLTIQEGNDGQRTASFLVELSAPASSPVYYSITTENGSALAGQDFVARSLSSRYLDVGRTRQTFDVPILGDTQVEADESFTVRLTSASGADILGGFQATCTILNDDAPAVKSSGAARARPKESRARVKAPVAP